MEEKQDSDLYPTNVSQIAFMAIKNLNENRNDKAPKGHQPTLVFWLNHAYRCVMKSKNPQMLKYYISHFEVLLQEHGAHKYISLNYNQEFTWVNHIKDLQEFIEINFESSTHKSLLDLIKKENDDLVIKLFFLKHLFDKGVMSGFPSELQDSISKPLFFSTHNNLYHAFPYKTQPELDRANDTKSGKKSFFSRRTNKIFPFK